MKFEVVGHLSDGQEMGMTLVQSWQDLRPYSEMERVVIRMPNNIAVVFMKKYEEMVDKEKTIISPKPVVVAGALPQMDDKFLRQRWD